MPRRHYNGIYYIMYYNVRIYLLKNYNVHNAFTDNEQLFFKMKTNYFYYIYKSYADYIAVININ